MPRSRRYGAPHGSDEPANDPVAIGAKCHHAVVAQLAEEGVPQEDLQPLSDLEARVRQFMAQTQGQGVANAASSGRRAICCLPGARR